jgi:YegS/Rv2252/BmrU family lipid kinase
MSEISVAIFINPTARTAKYRRTEKEITEFLLKEKATFTVYNKSWPDKLGPFTHVFVVGGDGTLNHFLNSYPDTKIPISLFKAGTGNDFQWKLSAVKSLAEQLKTAFHGMPLAVDAGICNGRYFINGVGIGFDGAVVMDFIKSRKWMHGNLAYYWAVIKTLSAYRSKQLVININNGSEQVEARCFMITVANGSRFGGNFMVAPQSSLTDNELDLVIIRAVSVFKRYFYLPRMKKGRHLSLPFVKTLKIQSVSVSAEKPIAAHLDGELMVSQQFDIHILPGHFFFRC